MMKSKINKKLQVYISILILIIFVIFQYSCKKNRTNYIDNKLKSIGDFSVGTYWIYYSDELKTFDTLTVINKEKEWIACIRSSDCEDDYEKINISIRSSFNNDTLIDILEFDQFYGGLTFKRKIDNSYVFKLKYIDNEFVPCKEIYNDTTYKTLDIISSIGDSNTNEYIAIIKSEIIQGIYKIVNVYYFVPNIGILMHKDKIDGVENTWMLYKYEIKK